MVFVRAKVWLEHLEFLLVCGREGNLDAIMENEDRERCATPRFMRSRFALASSARKASTCPQMRWEFFYFQDTYILCTYLVTMPHTAKYSIVCYTCLWEAASTLLYTTGPFNDREQNPKPFTGFSALEAALNMLSISIPGTFGSPTPSKHPVYSCVALFN